MSLLPVIKCRVVGNSMFPNFRPGEVVLVERVSKRFRPLRRGEVVTVERDGMLMIKRVIERGRNTLTLRGDNLDRSSAFEISSRQVVGRVFVRINS